MKDKGIALILEILPGLFGFYGIGWIYSNNVGTGILLLIFGLVLLPIMAIISISSGGFACCCAIPLNLAIVGLSSYSLNNYAKARPMIFR